MSIELSGAELDAAVARLEGKSDIPGQWAKAFINDLGRCSISKNSWDCARYFEPSKKWSDGGPIIERERIAIGELGGGEWAAAYPTEDCSSYFQFRDGIDHATGPTPLIAAMRAFVASKTQREGV